MKRNAFTLLAVFLALVASVSSCSAADAATVAYFSIRGTVASSRLAGAPTVVWQEAIFFVGDQGIHQEGCLVAFDTYGGAPVPPVEITATLAYSLRNPAGPHYSADSPAVCSVFLEPDLSTGRTGTCLIVSGRVLSAPDALGDTTIADSVARCR